MTPTGKGPRYTHIRLPEAAQGLEANILTLHPQKDAVQWNLNRALLAICRELERLARDVEFVQNKTDAILRSVRDGE